MTATGPGAATNHLRTTLAANPDHRTTPARPSPSPDRGPPCLRCDSAVRTGRKAETSFVDGRLLENNLVGACRATHRVNWHHSRPAMGETKQDQGSLQYCVRLCAPPVRTARSALLRLLAPRRHPKEEACLRSNKGCFPNTSCANGPVARGREEETSISERHCTSFATEGGFSCRRSCENTPHCTYFDAINATQRDR